MTTTIRVVRHADVRAVLSDPGFVVPAPPEASDGAAPLPSVPSLAWLRRRATRFSTGADHRRRRALASALLTGLPPVELRSAAADRARSAGPDEAPYVPVAVLAEALGVPRSDVPNAVAAVRDVAPAYFPGAGAGSERRADTGVRTLVGMLPDVAPEETAQRVCLLVQTCDATAGLIRAALEHGVPQDDDGALSKASVTALLSEALRFSPPAPLIRRVAERGTRIRGAPVAAGSEVVLDLAAANRDPDVYASPDRFVPHRFSGTRPAPPALSFGYGERPCPGSDHALAMATGVLHAHAVPARAR
ncbi:cytochrome P450 [Nocardiopsis halophila]|uniref:cytochrome P450 n=1 Tax=Nocardiopsis halophila TaxID=141692 RepID=UPI00034B2997|nr:cytochrome P450 [Nocardiopsis halophila]